VKVSLYLYLSGLVLTIYGFFSLLTEGFVYKKLVGISISYSGTTELYTTIWKEVINFKGIITTVIGILLFIVCIILERRSAK
jgi:hypothetical protein